MARHAGCARASHWPRPRALLSLLLHPPIASLPHAGSYADTHSFSSYANWLVPGALMLGRYPHCEPSRLGQDRERGEAQLDKILRAGVTTFVCLQVRAACSRAAPARGPAPRGCRAATDRHTLLLSCAAGSTAAWPLPRASQAELPPQEQMKLGGVRGFLPYKATAELIKSSLSK